jgi:molybdopterin-guanine dinucleotide biosynthesis protein A
MHGLILAGGEGSRLAASGVTMPKALVPVGGVPQLLRLARLLERAGAESVTCLLRRGVSIEPVAAELDRLRIPVGVHECLTPSSLHTLVAGLAVTPAGEVFCTMVDTVMPAADWLRTAGESRRRLAGGADAVLVVTPFVDDERPLYVARDDSGRVARITDEAVPAREVASAALAAGQERMRAFLKTLVRERYDVRAVEVAKVVDLDHRRDLDAANAWQESCEDDGPPMAQA